MRILVLTREFPPAVRGGLGFHLANLYAAMVERGHAVTVLTGVARDAHEGGADLVHDAIDVHRVPYAGVTGGYLTLPVQLRRGLRRLAVDSFDVAVTHTPLPFGLPIPTVGKYHDCPQVERQYFRRDQGPVERIGDSAVNPLRRWVDRRSLRTVDHAIFNSELNRDAWESEYDLETESTVIHNGVDTDVFRPTDDGPQESYVLFVGAEYRKGLDRVLDYARQGEVPVYVVGEVTTDVENVRVVGWVDQERLAALYTGALATVHPARFEAFGNVVLESLSCGTPVVTTSSTGASELLDDAVGSVDVDLQTGIERCRGIASTACRDRATEQTWGVVANRTGRTLLGLLEGHGA